MVTEGRRFAAWNREAAEKLAQNFAEYWIEEQPLLARPADVRQFLTDADQLRDDLARLEKRIEILTRKVLRDAGSISAGCSLYHSALGAL